LKKLSLLKINIGVEMSICDNNNEDIKKKMIANVIITSGLDKSEIHNALVNQSNVFLQLSPEMALYLRENKLVR
jgi:hypothetical protein